MSHLVRVSRPRPILLALLSSMVASCGSDAVDGGPPVLTKALVIAPGAMEQPDLLPEGGDGGAADRNRVSPLAQLKLVFSQLLDGNKIESILDGGGVKGGRDVVALTWQSAPVGAREIVGSTTYDPSGAAGPAMPAPSVRVVPDPGLPSGATIQVELDRAKITSKGGKAMEGPDSFTMHTVPFAATVNFMPGATVAPEFGLHVDLTNVPGADFKQHVVVRTAAGVTVAVDVGPDPMDPRVLLVMPAAAGAGAGPAAWPLGAYTLTVAKDLSDLFGVELAADVAVSFTIARTSGDAGAASDGGAPLDAGSDAAPPDDAAVDAGAG